MVREKLPKEVQLFEEDSHLGEKCGRLRAKQRCNAGKAVIAMHEEIGRCHTRRDHRNCHALRERRWRIGRLGDCRIRRGRPNRIDRPTIAVVFAASARADFWQKRAWLPLLRSVL